MKLMMRVALALLLLCSVSMAGPYEDAAAAHADATAMKSAATQAAADIGTYLTAALDAYVCIEGYPEPPPSGFNETTWVLYFNAQQSAAGNLDDVTTAIAAASVSSLRSQGDSKMAQGDMMAGMGMYAQAAVKYGEASAYYAAVVTIWMDLEAALGDINDMADLKLVGEPFPGF